MKATAGQSHGLSKGFRRLVSGLWWGDHLPAPLRRDAGLATPEPLERYVGAVFQSLALFRLVSFAMGAGLVFLLNPSDRPLVLGLAPVDREEEVLGLVVMLVGSYNVYRILWRVDPARPQAVVQWVSLAIDLLLSVCLILVSRGLDSPFLIYSLSPILTASLLMNKGAAVAVAALSGASVSGMHLLAKLGVTNLPWLLDGNYLVLALLYSSVCFLVVSLPFLANLNWQRRVRTESLVTERQRLRRDVHDNVAQTLAFLSLKMKLAEQRAARGRAPITERDVAEISSIVERTYLAVRDYLDGNEAESEAPLRTRLAVVAQEWSRDTGLPINVSANGEEGDISPQVKFQMVQVAREALANVAKHAYPTNVWLDLECTPTAVSIRVRDDGRGFSNTGIRGHGMGIMNERAAMAGADLKIDSELGEGTEVVVAYPRGQEQEGS